MPTWSETINLRDVFHNDELDFTKKRDAIVRRVRRSAWFKDYDEFDELPQLVEELSETTSGDEFDQPWGCIYDIADADRVWIATI